MNRETFVGSFFEIMEDPEKPLRSAPPDMIERERQTQPWQVLIYTVGRTMNPCLAVKAS